MVKFFKGPHMICPFLGGSTTQSHTKVYVTSTPGQVDRRFRLLGRGLGSDKVVTVGEDVLGRKKKTSWRPESLVKDLSFFCVFSMIFVSPWSWGFDLFILFPTIWLGENTQTFSTWCVVWTLISCCLSYKKKSVLSLQKATVSDFLSQAYSHDQPQGNTPLTLPAIDPHSPPQSLHLPRVHRAVCFRECVMESWTTISLQKR